MRFQARETLPLLYLMDPSSLAMPLLRNEAGGAQLKIRDITQMTRLPVSEFIQNKNSSDNIQISSSADGPINFIKLQPKFYCFEDETSKSINKNCDSVVDPAPYIKQGNVENYPLEEKFESN